MDDLVRRRLKSKSFRGKLTYLLIALLVFLFALNLFDLISERKVIIGVFISIALNAIVSLVLAFYTKQHSISSLALNKEEKLSYFIALSFIQVVLLAVSIAAIYLLVR